MHVYTTIQKDMVYVVRDSRTCILLLLNQLILKLLYDLTEIVNSNVDIL